MTWWQQPTLLTRYAAADDPLEVTVVRDRHLRASNGDVEDDYIQSLITTSLAMAQFTTQRPILPQRYRRDGRGFERCIELPHAPLLEVEDVTYYDADGALHTVDESVYHVVKPYAPDATRGHLELRDGQSWPTVAIRPDAVQITYRSGYLDMSVSPNVIDVPEPITRGRLLVIKDLYENRGISFVGPGNVVSPAAITAEQLWLSYRDRTAAG